MHTNPIFDPNQVLLVTDERDTVSAVSEALKTNGEFSGSRVCRGIPQLVLRLESGRSAAVLVDIDQQPGRILADLESVISRFPDSRFVVLSKERGDSLMIEAMQVGARHFLVKQSIREDLADVLHRLVPSGPLKRKTESPLITVLSAGGGCGATSIAVNLAKELHLLSGQQTFLVDMDCYYGGVATYLGLEGQYGLGDVLTHRGAIDPDLIQTTSVPCGNGMRALLSPASTNFRTAGPLASQRLPDAVKALSHSGTCTVIDAPRLGSEMDALLALSSRVTLLVFQLCVKDIRAAKAIQDSLLRAGVEPNRVLAIANRFRKRHSIVNLDDAGAVLQCRIERLQNDYKAASAALNFGQSLADAAPRSILRREIVRLAETIRKNYLGQETLSPR